MKNKLKNLFILFIFSLIAISCNNEVKHILVFTKTAEYRHDCIGLGKNALLALGKLHNIKVDTSEDGNIFTDNNLRKYSTIVFLCTTGDILNYNQQIALERYIQAGGGFVGIHSAGATEKEWIWYTNMIGGNFVGHSHVQQATIEVINNLHPATIMLPKKWNRNEEWYNFTSINPQLQILATVDEKTYQGGTHGDYHPLIWCHDYDGGKVFYTACGQTEESYSEKLFLQHISGGILYSIGDNIRDYRKCRSQYTSTHKKDFP